MSDVICVKEYENEEPEILMHTRINGDCVFLNPSTNKCSQYESRPTTCRIFPYGDDDESLANPDSRTNWILKHCPLYKEYNEKSEHGKKAMKLLEKARQHESEINSTTIRLIHDLEQKRESRLEERWGFQKGEEYAISYWAQEKAPLEEMITALKKYAHTIQKSQVGLMVYFYDRNYKALCCIQGVFPGGNSPINQFEVPGDHKDLRKLLDRLETEKNEKNKNVTLVEGWIAWPIKNQSLN